MYVYYLYSTCSHKHLDSTPCCSSWPSLDIYIFSALFLGGESSHISSPPKKTVDFCCFSSPQGSSAIDHLVFEAQGCIDANSFQQLLGLGIGYISCMDTAYVREKPPPPYVNNLIRFNIIHFRYLNMLVNVLMKGWWLGSNYFVCGGEIISQDTLMAPTPENVPKPSFQDPQCF